MGIHLVLSIFGLSIEVALDLPPKVKNTRWYDLIRIERGYHGTQRLFVVCLLWGLIRVLVSSTFINSKNTDLMKHHRSPFK